MSKKTKRLEKENHNLTRKHDLTNHNILQMAEERTKTNKEMEMLRKKNDNLEKLCRGMQAQGRGQTSNMEVGEMGVEDEGTESEYEYDEDEEAEGSEDGDYNEDTEEEAALAGARGPPTFGPVPPPPPAMTATPPSLQSKVNGHVNGLKH